MTLPRDTLLLASGLSVFKANSFSRQLRLLKRFLEKLEYRVVLAGRAAMSRAHRTASPAAGPAEQPIGGMLDVDDFSKDIVDNLVSANSISAAILLGYPDQFQFLEGSTAFPVYFWYQASRPAAPPDLQPAVVVPLTPMTAMHLQTAGCSKIGPIIPHGVDIDVFRPAEERGCNGGSLHRSAAGDTSPHRDAPRGPTLLTLGANSHRKRFDRLIEAFSLVIAELPDARLLIKTDFAKKPGGFDLVRLAERFGVKERVSIIDNELSDTELARLYASADMYVHTAEWEGFCIPVIEAMACGLPVVTHPVQGPGEIVPYPDLLVPGSRTVKDGDVELLMADPGAFAKAIIRIAKDPLTARRASSEGRAAAVGRFDIRLVVEKWLKLLFSP